MERPNGSELRVMDVLWNEGTIPAKRIAEVLMGTTDWTKNTIYTLISRVVSKGLVQRADPGFVCRALISREEIQQEEAEKLVDKLFSGSASKLFAALVNGRKIPRSELDKLEKMIDDMK